MADRTMRPLCTRLAATPCSSARASSEGITDRHENKVRLQHKLILRPGEAPRGACKGRPAMAKPAEEGSHARKTPKLTCRGLPACIPCMFSAFLCACQKKDRGGRRRRTPSARAS